MSMYEGSAWQQAMELQRERASREVASGCGHQQRRAEVALVARVLLV
jgi:hypothetical protein